MKATSVSQGKAPKLNGASNKKASKRPTDENYALLEDYFEDQPLKKVYMKENLLGMGGFARVYKVTELEAAKKISFADKVISKAIFKKRVNAKEKFQKEIEINIFPLLYEADPAGRSLHRQGGLLHLFL